MYLETSVEGLFKKDDDPICDNRSGWIAHGLYYAYLYLILDGTDEYSEVWGWVEVWWLLYDQRRHHTWMYKGEQTTGDGVNTWTEFIFHETVDGLTFVQGGVDVGEIYQHKEFIFCGCDEEEKDCGECCLDCCGIAGEVASRLGGLGG